MYENRRINIAIPSAEKADIAFYENILKLITGHGLGNVTIGVSFAVSSRIVGNRNTLVQKSRDFGATDILWIDTDTLFPEQGLKKLLDHNLDIVCGTTCKRDDISYDVFCQPLDPDDIGKSKKMVKARVVGFPFMLTKMSVFDAMRQPYFAEPPRYLVDDDGDNNDAMPEDEFFCLMARRAGFDVWCDLELSANIKHVGRKVFVPNSKPEKLISKKIRVA